MRLTLRTMLALLDDILEPSDAQVLEQKIEESKFATDLVHRIRSSTRRLRLGAPKVDGRGMADDPNTVAEYLDNTMPAEKVQEFEKICLESDVHLAEVACAHQILTHVLREPASFDPVLRDRIYVITPEDSVSQPPAEAAQASDMERSSLDSPPVAAGAARAAVTTQRVSAERAGPVVTGGAKSGLPLKSLAITLLLGFILAAVALRAMGEFGPNHPVLRYFAGTQPEPTPVAANTDTAEAASDSPAVDVVPATPPASTETPADGASTSTAASTLPPAPPPAPTVVTDTVPPTTSGTAEAASPPATTVENIPPAATPAVPAPEVVEPAPGTSETPRPADMPETGENPFKPLVTGEVRPAPSDVASVPRPKTSDLPKSPMIPEQPLAAPIKAGVFLSEEQTIARFDKGAGSWEVLPVNSTLSVGDDLLAMPTYRPQIIVAQNVKLTLSGPALLRLDMPDASNVPRITVNFGQATLIPVGEMGGSLTIDVGGRAGIITFEDIDSAAAIDVRLYLPPGMDPASSAPHLVVQLWATSGSVVWHEQGRPEAKLAAGQLGWFIDDGDIVRANMGAIPDWIDGKNLSDIDRRASQELRKFLTPERTLALSLMEQTNYRQVEVRALCCRALCYLDIYEPALLALGDEQYKAYWFSCLDALRDRMAQGVEPAAKIRAAVDKLFNDQAEVVHRLLVGYSPEQLEDGGAKQLVEDLSNSKLSVRVLALENLRRITGKSMLFKPEDRTDQGNKRSILNWQKDLEAGLIQYKAPPDPISAFGLPAPSDKPAGSPTK